MSRILLTRNREPVSQRIRVGEDDGEQKPEQEESITNGSDKKQSPRPGEANKLNKRAKVLQASYAEQNIGTVEEEQGAMQRSFEQMPNPKRAKAGR